EEEGQAVRTAAAVARVVERSEDAVGRRKRGVVDHVAELVGGRGSQAKPAGRARGAGKGGRSAEVPRRRGHGRALKALGDRKWVGRERWGGTREHGERDARAGEQPADGMGR